MNYGERDPKTYLDLGVTFGSGCLTIAEDQAKFNLAWLVFPEIGVFGLPMIPDEFCDAMQYMDTQTREHLLKLPMVFMRYWRGIDNGELALSVGMPEDYKDRMKRQAVTTQRRLVGVVATGNVVSANFRRAA